MHPDKLCSRYPRMNRKKSPIRAQMELMKSVLPTVLLALSFAASAEAGAFAFSSQPDNGDNVVRGGVTTGGDNSETFEGERRIDGGTVQKVVLAATTSGIRLTSQHEIGKRQQRLVLSDSAGRQNEG